MHSTGVALASLLVTAASVFGIGLPSTVSLVLLLLSVAFIGVPHGGLDHWTGRRLLAVRFPRTWAFVFFPIYLAIASMVLLGWDLFPLVTAVGFFLVSAWHFGLEDEPCVYSSNIIRSAVATAIGGMVIWVPVLMQPLRVESLLASILPSEFAASASTIVATTCWIAIVLMPVAGLAIAQDMVSVDQSRASSPKHLPGNDVCDRGRRAFVRHLLLRVAFDSRSKAFGQGKQNERLPGPSFGHAVVDRSDLACGGWNVVLVLRSDAHRDDDKNTLRFSIGNRSATPLVARTDNRDRHSAESASGIPAGWGDAMTLTDNPGKFDYILVGGGLQSGLIALALRHHRPDSSVLLIERDGRLGGNHTWSFHPGDVSESSRAWIDPIIRHRWPQYQVRIDHFSRRVGLAYASIPSDHFADVVAGLFETGPGPVLTQTEPRSFSHGFRRRERCPSEARGSSRRVTSSNICVKPVRTCPDAD